MSAAACRRSMNTNLCPSSRSILVVEDDDDLRDAMVFTLLDEGYEVTVAADGRDALDLLHTMQRPALVLVDLMMPVMDGRALVNAMREHEALAKIPVVVISGFSGLLSNIPPADGVLKKPVDRNELLETVRRFFR